MLWRGWRGSSCILLHEEVSLSSPWALFLVGLLFPSPGGLLPPPFSPVRPPLLPSPPPPTLSVSQYLCLHFSSLYHDLEENFLLLPLLDLHVCVWVTGPGLLCSGHGNTGHAPIHPASWWSLRGLGWPAPLWLASPPLSRKWQRPQLARDGPPTSSLSCTTTTPPPPSHAHFPSQPHPDTPTSPSQPRPPPSGLCSAFIPRGLSQLPT